MSPNLTKTSERLIELKTHLLCSNQIDSVNRVGVPLAMHVKHEMWLPTSLIKIRFALKSVSG